MCCVVADFSQHNNLKLLCCDYFHNTTVLNCCVVKIYHNTSTQQLKTVVLWILRQHNSFKLCCENFSTTQHFKTVVLWLGFGEKVVAMYHRMY